MSVLHERSLLSVIWCDDIRQELGNKLSFMGVYDLLVVPSKPVVLPRLAAHITIHRPIDKPFTKCAFKVVKSDDETPLAAGELDVPDGPPVPKKWQESGDPPKVSFFAIGTLLANVVITEKTDWLMVEATVDDETLQSLKLRVDTAAEQGA
jgi:hypothetical protein